MPFRLISFFLFLVCFPVSAQEYARLCGSLHNKEGEPLAFANVHIKGSSLGTVTDTLGNYCMEVPAEKDVVLVFSYLGYLSREVPVRLIPGEEGRKNLILSPDETQLEEVMVEADKQRSNSFVKLDIKAARNIPNTSGQFETILKTLPGVSSNNELSSQYSVRGGNFDENLVYVNDIQVYRPFLIRSGQQEGLSFINPDLVSSVKFSAGGFGAEYGDKMSSVLDIKYRRPERYEASASTSFLGGSVHMEGVTRNKRFAFLTGIRYKTNRYLLQSVDEAGSYQPSFFDIQSYLSYEAGRYWEISFLGNMARNSYLFIPESRTTSFGTVSDAVQLYVLYEGQEKDEFDSYTGALTASFQPASDLSMKWMVSVFRTEEAETYDIQGWYSLNEIEQELGSENLGDSIMNLGIGSFLNHARNTLTGTIVSSEYKGKYTGTDTQLGWGLGIQKEIVDNTVHEWQLVDSAGYSVPYDNESLNLSYTRNGTLSLNSTRINAYVSYKKTFYSGNSRWNLEAGIRSNYWDLTGEIFLSPRASLWFDPDWQHDLQFHLSGGWYYQPPFFREFLDKEGNSNLDIQAQRSIHLVLGGEYHFTAWDRPFLLSGEAYYKWMDRLIPYKVDNVRITYAGENMAKGYAIGTDLKIYGEFVPGTDSWISVSLMQTREDITGDSYINEEGETVEPGYYPRPTDQRLSVGMYFQDYLPGDPSYRVQLSMLYGSRLPVSSPYSERYDQVFRMPPYRRVDIGFVKVFIDEELGMKMKGKASWEHLRHLSLSLEVFNLLDIHNTISYLWVSTVNDLSGESHTYAVPNYLTSRRLNLKLSMRF